jgi:hypothetical protein
MAKRTAINPTDNQAAQPSDCVEYHIVPNGDRWDVERDSTFLATVVVSLPAAIAVAVEAAHRDLQNGAQAMVCVQESNGHCRKVWP